MEAKLMDPLNKNSRIEEKDSAGDYDAAMALALSSQNVETMHAIETCYCTPTEKRF
jgi:hypothetical protein